MKLLFVISGLSAGGAERILVEYANYFSEQGNEVTILILSEEEVFYRLNTSIKVVRLINRVESSFNSKIIRNIKKIFEMKKIFLRINSDIIISYITFTNLFSIVSARLAKQKIIVSEHTNISRNENSLLGFFRRLIYPYANAVVCLTEYDKKRYSKFIDNIYSIKNPLTLQNKHNNVERKNIILGVGRLINLKGFDTLIKAFSNIKQKDWELVIVGEGPEKEKLKSLANNLNIYDRVKLVGLSQDIERYYKEASIYVLSSRIEGFPNALCEAMGYGCACVAFDCLTGPRDIINNGVDGILVKPENITDLTCAIQKLVDNPELRLSFGSKAKNIVKQLDINILSKKWISIFDSII